MATAIASGGTVTKRAEDRSEMIGGDLEWDSSASRANSGLDVSKVLLVNEAEKEQLTSKPGSNGSSIDGRCQTRSKDH